MTTRWAIEDSFPIVEINRLAVPERNAFKPIYQMHKWFARRASSVFRAILLGCLKPLPVDKNGNPTKSGAQIIMEEFYKDHTRDPDTNGKVILDPFMGGGTTVVEALRLGCKVIGIDLNPVAWFIVKTETTPVDVKQLERAFDDLANRVVPWSGKPLKQTLLDLYKTTCPCCGNTDADIIYAFWVKSAICTDPTCHKQVPLFSDYFVAAKQPSIHYYQDVSCPKCHKTFDWEIEPASLIAEPSLIVVNPLDGSGRGNKRWAFATEEPVACPWCGESIEPQLAAGKTEAARKKVPLTVLLCPHCQVVWQYRGSIPNSVICPACKHEYEPRKGNTPESGKFVCPHCGKKDAVLSSIRSLPADQPLPMSMYALQGYCLACGKGASDEDAEEEDTFKANLGASVVGSRVASVASEPSTDKHRCLLAKSGGKFFKRIDPADLDLYTQASKKWEQNKEHLSYPRQEIRVGEKTKTHLIGHHYRFWHQMFNLRQLLCLSSLIQCVMEESDPILREHLLCTASNALEGINMFARYTRQTGTVQGLFSRHDYHPLHAPTEVSAWGSPGASRKTFCAAVTDTIEAKRFLVSAYDHVPTGKLTSQGRAKFRKQPNGERCEGETVLLAGDARSHLQHHSAPVDMVVTDPPYVGNIQYSELAEFFYVWQRLVLASVHSEFAPEETPKLAEISTNRVRGQTESDFENSLSDAFARAEEATASDALCVFTFHHAERSAWECLLRAVLNAGLVVIAVYPIQGEREESTHLIDKQSISYDLIHVCRKRGEGAVEARSWAGIRQEIRQRARQEIETIERGRYGNEPLSPADVNIILIGKCLELYSHHYGHVLDHEGNNVPLHEALKTIRKEVDQLTSQEQPLPSELTDIDPVSYVYLVCLANKAFEIKGDELNKYTRGGIVDPEDLLQAGLIIKGRTGRGRFFKIKSPAERFSDIQERLGRESGQVQPALPGMEEAVAADARGKTPFIDYVHFLIALVDGGENLRPWMERFRGQTPQIRAACEYLRAKQPRFADACGKILKFIEVTPLFG